MADINSIFIPKRISQGLRRVYSDRVTVIYAPDGTGKSTLMREFINRTRPDGTSIRFITSAVNTGDCFSQICTHVTGKPLSEPVSDTEYIQLREEFEKAAPEKELVLIIDCSYSGDTLLGNQRTAQLLAECRRAHFVFICSSLKPNYRRLAAELKFTLVARENIAMNPDEIAEYARRCGVSINTAEVYSACQGTFLGARLCFMMALQGQEFSGLSTETKLYKAVLEQQTQRTHGALIMVSAFGVVSQEFCVELRSLNAICDFFGKDLLEPGAMFDELQKLRRVIPLMEINMRRHTVQFHPILMHSIRRLFDSLPENVQHDLRICYGREFLRNRKDYYAFCEFFLAGEYELAAEIHNNERITYSLLMRSSGLLNTFIMECQLTCKAAIPRLLRVSSMLMQTDLKHTIQTRYSEIIAYITNSPDYSATERHSLLSYAYALRANESLYVLDRMGASIKRAYDMFRGKREFDSPLFAWTMYSPTVFFLIHRRGYSVHTETAQFTRYQHMYTEMLDHGRFTEIIFSGEAKYTAGDLSGGLELLSAAASLCTGSNRIATRLTAMYCAAKCCLFLGDHKRFFEFVRGILRIERANFSREEGDCARLMIGLLSILRGGTYEDTWYALCADQSDPIMNRFTAPYFSMVKAHNLLRIGMYDILAENSERYLETASTAGNEAAGIKLRLFAAHALMSIGSWDKAIRYAEEALECARENGIPAEPAEYYAIYPEFFRQIRGLTSPQLQPFIDDVERLGKQFLRGVETVRSYEITYLSNAHRDNYAEHYLVPLKHLIVSTRELREKLGLSEKAYSYAIMAASDISNEEMSRIFSVSCDSIKSSLKRTYKALGVSSRRGLIGIIPTLK